MKLTHTFARRMLASLACAATIAMAPTARAADEKPAAKAETTTTEKSAEKAGEKKAAKKDEDRRGPIPALYGKIVAPDQKEKIYAIQEKYQADLAPLTAKIKEVMAARDKEIEAVLTPEQLAKLKEMKAEAAKRPMKKATVVEAKATATEKPAEKPAEATK